MLQVLLKDLLSACITLPVQHLFSYKWWFCKAFTAFTWISKHTDSWKLSHWAHENLKQNYFWLIFFWVDVWRFCLFRGVFLFICFVLQEVMQCCLCWKNQISRKAFLVQSSVLPSASIGPHQCLPLLQLHLCWKLLSCKGAASFRSSTSFWNWPEVLLQLWPKESWH